MTASQFNKIASSPSQSKASLFASTSKTTTESKPASGDASHRTLADEWLRLLDAEQFTEARNFLDQHPDWRPDWLTLPKKIKLADGQIQTVPLIRYLREKLCDYINDADQIKTDALLKVYPRLVCGQVRQVIHRQTGQVYRRITPFQLAYSEGDFEMCEMMLKYFVLAYGSEEKAREAIQNQIHSKYGAPRADCGLSTTASDLEARLQPMIQAITDESFGDGRRGADKKFALSQTTRDAINAFRTAFIESQPKIIEYGMRFHWEILHTLYEMYAAAIKKWNYNYPKCCLFEDAVISTVLGYAAKNDAQRFSQGLCLQQSPYKETFKRYSQLRYGKLDFYVALQEESPDFHLKSAYVCIYYGSAACLRGAPDWQSIHSFKIHFEQKQQRFLAVQAGRVVEPEAPRSVRLRRV